ncbi:hypothetical protein M1K46_17650 [Fictibacillus sp. WQ 8-8]|uniref:Integrase n=1 Tax=Fictibacillus terranigra TaxID=3058424 RepID=A0ABT8EBD1_9BACL|nr:MULTISPECIES: hypothetical protein [unclassified Fictibacillus]SFE53782.1 hypothetical protein SAMN05428981_106147 [Bacillus sp. OV194]MCQ6267461.1 hypothetical protein [Fictibacillus sp. WQ 8-8]MDN4075201.1 hypothetical protein [Fictibacillus sp. CENA-BCM004]MED2973049.1 hypothetical protein [Fictibacillus sp. B-59209]UZJ78362.1 hypothetical protein OKX00_19900 [Fictibacillus sp. KU28468]
MDYSQVVERYFFLIRKRHLKGALNMKEYNKKVELINLWFIRHTLRSGLAKKGAQ